MERKPNTQYVLSLSYGKDSIACIEALYQLGYPLDRIIHAEVWATDDIPADLPSMVEFKKRADAIIKFRYGIEVEHICALDKDGSKLTYEKMFYHKPVRKKKTGGGILGFPQIRGIWCNSQLKLSTLQRISSHKRKLVQEAQNNKSCLAASENGFLQPPHLQGAITNTVKYLGIAADEPERIKRHGATNVLPLVEIGWNEEYCRKWCEDNSLLSPTYDDALRGGCWFCHNQSVGQLRILRKKYPEYWQLLLKWDLDSPVTFKPDGHTVHDFERRFSAEDNGLIKPNDTKFRWKQVLSSES